MHKTTVFAVIAVIALWPDIAQAGDDTGSSPNRGIFFGGSFSGSMAWIDYPDEDQSGKAGAVFDFNFGWWLSPRLMLGGHYGTWGTSIIGTPLHLHLVGPRIDYRLKESPGFDGVFVTFAPGLALIEPVDEAHSGIGGIIKGGYRYQWEDFTTVGAHVGLKSHLFADGFTVIPFAGVNVQFYGLTR
ncbi:hypothetical protein [Natronogracilivirga saccharolytica]|uniref:Outer membrane protein beta-barrel domain-containing protein n=1 Tax=Natronogracilivirga saccharolytica TaxID=2812953 RepID=A0A8J7USZ3_9BACT|nr:hypothetical protein [Natronogracilivirga saccharolytica]MBP3192081.1 hypothetical protein [Natronogracilivirga saccharolytica]